MGSLRTFEINFEEQRAEKKTKGIALKVDTTRDNLELRYDNDDEDMIESFEMLSNNMRHVKKKMNRRPNNGVPQRAPSSS